MTWKDSAEVTADTDREPTLQELREIEVEWPLIAAELAVVDAEIAALQNGPYFCELDRRRLRRAEAQLTRQIAAEAQSPLDGVA